MVDLSYRVEKRLIFTKERCPDCGRRARYMVEESHLPGHDGLPLSGHPHIARAFYCAKQHLWRYAAYDGATFELVSPHAPKVPNRPKTPRQSLTEGIPLRFLIPGLFILIMASAIATWWLLTLVYG